MSPEQLVAVVGALATIAIALVRLYGEIRSVHHLVNSRMTELLDLTRQAARAQGVLDAGQEPRGPDVDTDWPPFRS